MEVTKKRSDSFPLKDKQVEDSQDLTSIQYYFNCPWPKRFSTGYQMEGALTIHPRSKCAQSNVNVACQRLRLSLIIQFNALAHLCPRILPWDHQP